MKPLKIFVVDDDPMQLEMITDHLGNFRNFSFKTFSTGEAMLACIGEKPDIVILDYNLDSVDKSAQEGADILRELKQRDERVEVIMYSGQDNIDVAITTMRYGAFDYVVKNPTAFHRMENIIHKIIKHRELQADARRYKRMLAITGYLLLAIVAFAIIARLAGWTAFFNKLNV